jgi:hypothetical protein
MVPQGQQSNTVNFARLEDTAQTVLDLPPQYTTATNASDSSPTSSNTGSSISMERYDELVCIAEPTNREIHVNFLRVGFENKKKLCQSDMTLLQAAAAAFPGETDNKQVKAIMNGAVCDVNSTLAAAGINDGSFVHISITEPKSEEELRAEQMRAEPDPETDLAQFAAWQEYQQMAQVQANNNARGSNVQLMIGFLIGTVFGVIALLWLIQRGVPWKQKVGIGIGIAFNTLFTLVQYFAGRNSSSSANGT